MKNIDFERFDDYRRERESQKKRVKKINDLVGNFVTKIQELGIFTVAVHVKDKEDTIITTGIGDATYYQEVSIDFLKATFELAYKQKGQNENL